MQLPSHLRLSRHGVWCFRLVLPDIIASTLGQKEIRKSLGTRCPQTAKYLAYHLSGKILPIVRKAKHTMTLDPNSIDPKSVRELIVKGLEIDRNTGTFKVEYLETNPDPEIAKREFAALWAMTQGGAPAPIGNEEKPAARPVCGTPCTIEEAKKAFLAHKGDLAPGSRKTYAYRLDLFASLVGGAKKILNHITKQDCIQAAEDFRNSAPHATKRAEGITGQGIVTASTVKDMLTLWQSFFEWAIGTDRYAGENPVTKIPRPSKNAAQRGAEAFRADELATIFQAQNFAEMNRPHQYWGPLIALFTGARSNEIAQLRLSDFKELEGVRCFHITEDKQGGTRTKNAASNRILPIHPTLWAIGLDAYLTDLRAIGADRLFPNLPKDAQGKREKYLSRDFNENLLGKIGLRQPRVKVFHSFRDTVAGKLASAQIHAAHIADWLGHVRQGTEGEHYIGPLTPAQQVGVVLPALDFKLNFSGFKYEPGRWNDWLKRNRVA